MLYIKLVIFITG